MEVESAVDKPVDKKKWAILFSVFGVVILGLIIAIVVILATRNNTSEPVEEEPEVPEYVPKEKTEGEQIYEDAVTSINYKLENVYAEDIERTFDLYKGYINVTTNPEAKAMLELDYYQMLMAYDATKEQKKEILARLVEIDDQLKSINSAVTIMNAAMYYNDDALYEKYDTILTERETAEGLNIGGGSDG